MNDDDDLGFFSQSSDVVSLLTWIHCVDGKCKQCGS